MGIEIALRGISPAWLASGRITIAAAAMICVWILKGKPRLSRTVTPSFLATIFAMAITNTVLPFMLVSWAQQHVSSGFAGISMSSVALLVVPLAHFTCPDERLTLPRAVGLSIGFLGVLNLFGLDAFSSRDNSDELLARIACVVAASCYATSSIMVRRLGPINPVALAAALLTIGAIVSIPVAAFVEGKPGLASSGAVLAMLALAIFPTAFTGFLSIIVIQRSGASFMSLTNYLTPVCAVILSIVILAESVSLKDLFSLLLILTGVATAQTRFRSSSAAVEQV